MTDRAISTVVDVSLCLLLVATAVVTLHSAPVTGPDPAAGRAEAVSTTLAASTATVSYVVDGRERTAHGTLAGLLADAALSNRTPSTGDQFRRAVRNATRPVLGGEGWRGQVVVTWRPYEDAATGGAVRVGSGPPPDADVHAASTRVPSGLAPVGRKARSGAERAGYRGVAAAIAAAVFPGVDAPGREAYERRTAEALERRFESPAAAAEAVGVDSVRVTVRTWSP